MPGIIRRGNSDNSQRGGNYDGIHAAEPEPLGAPKPRYYCKCGKRIPYLGLCPKCRPKREQFQE